MRRSGATAAATVATATAAPPTTPPTRRRARPLPPRPAPGTGPPGRPLTVPVARPAGGRSNPFGDAKPVDAAAKLAELDARDAQRRAEAAAARKAAKAKAEAEGGAVEGEGDDGGDGDAADAATPRAGDEAPPPMPGGGANARPRGERRGDRGDRPPRVRTDRRERAGGDRAPADNPDQTTPRSRARGERGGARGGGRSHTGSDRKGAPDLPPGLVQVKKDAPATTVKNMFDVLGDE